MLLLMSLHTSQLSQFIFHTEPLLNKQVMRIKFISLAEVDSIILLADIPGNEQLQGQDNSKSFNPLTPMSDQDRISPYNINTISTR